MRREVFLHDDLRAILASIAYTAAVNAAPDTPHRAAYRAGWRDALTAVALAAGITDTPGIIPHERSGTNGEGQQRAICGR